MERVELVYKLQIYAWYMHMMLECPASYNFAARDVCVQTSHVIMFRFHAFFPANRRKNIMCEVAFIRNTFC